MMEVFVLATLLVASEQLRMSCSDLNLKDEKNCSCTEIRDGQEIKCPGVNISFVIGEYDNVKMICNDVLSPQTTLPTLRKGIVSSLRVEDCLPTVMSIRDVIVQLSIGEPQMIDITGEVERLAKGQLANLTTYVGLERLGLPKIDQDVFVDQNTPESTLTALELSKNQLSQLDDTVFINLKQLIHLDLSYNQLSILPEDLFVNNRNLKFLALGYNRLTNISNELFRNQGKLQDLLLNNNQLKHLEGEWRGLASSVYLDLSYNQLVSMGEETSVLRNVGHLELRLELNNNNLTRVYPDWLKGVKSINLNENNIQTFKMNSLVNEMFDVTLFLVGNNITEVDIDVPLPFNSSLEVRLSDNPLICNCHLHSLLGLSRESEEFSFTIGDSHAITCGSPPSLKDRLVNNVTLEELKCSVSDKYIENKDLLNTSQAILK